MTTPKPIWRSRTLAVAGALIAAIESAHASGYLDTLDPHLAALALALVAGLRVVTRQPVSLRRPRGLVKLAPLLLALSLGACAGQRGPDLADTIADDLVMEADTGPERALRLAAVNAIVAELLTDRARADPSEAGRALVAVERLERVGQRADPANPWLYTELWDARRSVLAALAPAARARALEVIRAGLSASGGSYLRALRAGADAARIGSKVAAMGRDVDALVARVAAGTLAEPQARALLAERLALNRRRLAQLAELAD